LNLKTIEKVDQNSINSCKMNTKIVVIEDDRNISELIRYNLESIGYTVFISYDGESGYRLISEENPNLIILDLMLPKISGIELCWQIRHSETNFDIPVIILSAKCSESDSMLGYKIGADDYMTKPFSVCELQKHVKDLLQRTNAHTAEIFNK